MLMQGTESLSVAVLGVHKLRLGHFVANEQRLCMQMLFMDYFEDKILKISWQEEWALEMVIIFGQSP